MRECQGDVDFSPSSGDLAFSSPAVLRREASLTDPLRRISLRKAVAG